MNTKESAKKLTQERALANIDFQKSLIAEMWALRNDFSAALVITNALKSIKISKKILTSK